ncbi:MAG: phosphoserine phosphatase SerB [Actinomycetota bacterium]
MSLLVVLDVDSTLIQKEVIELIAARAQVEQEVEKITSRAMAGELDFAASLTERVALLEGLDEAVLQEVFLEIKVTDGVTELIEFVHSIGGKVGAVSGGFEEVLSPLAQKLKLDFYRANRLEVIEGKLSGRVSGKIIDRGAKATALLEWSEQSNIALSETVAVGDGANDIDMLQQAGFAVAFRPKPILRSYADLVIEENSLLPLVEVLKLRTS